jgi:hypothetical protein
MSDTKIECLDTKLDYPASPWIAAQKMPHCLQRFFTGDIPEGAFSDDIVKAMKVCLLGIKKVYGRLEGPTFEGMLRILSSRRGIKKSRLMELAKNLNPVADFHCDLIRRYSDFADEAKCASKTEMTRLIDLEPNDTTTKTAELTWTEMTIKTVPAEILIFCESNDYEDTLDLTNKQAIKLIGGMNVRSEQNFLQTEFGLAVCPICKKRKLRFNVSKFQDAILLNIKDLDVNIESYEHEIEEVFPCYIFCRDKREEKELIRKIEAANKITMTLRLLLRNTQTNVAQKILECIKVHETDKRFSYTSVSTEMLKTFRSKLGGSYMENLNLLARSFAGWIGGRDFEKEIFLIWCFSAPDDPMTVAFIGDSRVGKSDIFVSGLDYVTKFETPEDRKSADCDVVLQGENIKRTVFYIHRRDQHSGEFKLVKGKALRAQHGRLFIDSVTQCNQEIIGITREAIPQGKMIVGGAGATQTRVMEFVTRYGVTLNLVQEFHNYPNRYVAWRDGFPDIFTYFDLKRFSLVIPFAQEDVSASKMRDTYDKFLNAEIIGLSAEEFRMLKIFCDGLSSSDNYFWEDDVEESLGNLYESKMRKYRNSFIKPYSSDLRIHLRKMIKGIAFIHFKIDGTTPGRIHVKQEHVRRLEKLLDEYEQSWEFLVMLIEEKEFKHTVQEVYYKLKAIKEKAPRRYKIFIEIARQRNITIEDLARETGEDKRDVWSNLNVLIKDELVSRPSRSKYSLTHLGDQVYHRIVKDIKLFMEADESEDASELILSQMHGCETDGKGHISFEKIMWICPGMDHATIFKSVQILKERGLITEHELGKFEIL